jgi:hypothetical protein
MITDSQRILLVISVDDDVHATSVQKVLGTERCKLWNPDRASGLKISAEWAQKTQTSNEEID